MNHSTLYSGAILLLLLVTVISLPHHSIPRRVRFEPEPASWSQPIPVRGIDTQEARVLTPVHDNQVIHDGGLLIDDGQHVRLENCTFFLNGQLLARGNSSLTLRNVQLVIKYKTGWSTPGDLVPHPYLVLFRDSSKLRVIDASIFYKENLAEIGFLNNSEAFIMNSDASCVQLTVRDSSEVTIEGSKVGRVVPVQKARCFISNSTIDMLDSRVYDYDEDKRVYTDSHADVQNSRIGNLLLLFNGSEVTLTEPLKRHQEHFSVQESDFGGVETFWVTLENTDVDSYSVYAFDSKVAAINQTLYVLYVSGSLQMSDSTCNSLYVGGGFFRVVDSVISYFSPHTDTLLVMERSNIGAIHLHTFTGSCIFHQVQAETLSGHTSEGVIRGDLRLLNETSFSWWGEMKLRREYHVLVVEDGYAVEGVELRLLDDDGGVVWSGVSGFMGEAWFSLTYCNMLEVAKYNYVSNYTATYLLTVDNGDEVAQKTISISSSSPIVFTFTK